MVAALRRYDAAGWLRKMVGTVTARDLPEKPTEEEFRLSLRSGIILCNALNMIQPGAVPKVGLTPSLLPCLIFYFFYFFKYVLFCLGFTIGCCNCNWNLIVMIDCKFR